LRGLGQAGGTYRRRWCAGSTRRNATGDTNAAISPLTSTPSARNGIACTHRNKNGGTGAHDRNGKHPDQQSLSQQCQHQNTAQGL
jgi:hypothetical protein